MQAKIHSIACLLACISVFTINCSLLINILIYTWKWCMWIILPHASRKYAYIKPKYNLLYTNTSFGPKLGYTYYQLQIRNLYICKIYISWWNAHIYNITMLFIISKIITFFNNYLIFVDFFNLSFIIIIFIKPNI